ERMHVMRNLGNDDSLGQGNKATRLIRVAALILIATAAIYADDRAASKKAPPAKMGAVEATKANWSAAVDSNATSLFTEGKSVFRFDTFGDEAFWTDTLRLHQAIEGEKFGGVGGGVSPKTALAVGLKVDAE